MTVEEYLALKKKKQEEAARASATPTPTPSNQEGSKMGDFLNTPLSFLEEDPQYRRDSWIPDWKTGVGPVDFAGNWLINPLARPIEQFARIIPAVGFEGARAIDGMVRGYDKMGTMENPFVPGVEKSTPEQNAKMIAQRTGKAMFDVATLGKGSTLIKGGKVALNMIPRLMAEGAVLGAGQLAATSEKAPTVGEEIGAAGVGAVLNPATQALMAGGNQIIRKLLGKPTQEIIDDATRQAVQETALVKVPTPMEQAQARIQQRMRQTQMKDMSGGFPLGSRNPETGAIEVPPGGFSAFNAEGSAQLREPMNAFATEDMNEATKLLEAVMGKKKTAKLKADYIAGKVGEPFPSPERILVKPVGMRPQPVLGKYAIEKPFVNDLPTPIREIVDVAAPAIDDATPVHVPTHINNIPIEAREPSTLQVLARNIWQPMQSSVAKFGKAGEALSKKIDDFRAQEYTTRGKNQVEIDKAFKNLKLSAQEADNFWEAAQGMAEPINQKVAQAVEKSREFANKFFQENTKRGILENMVDNSGSPIIDPNNYLSHMFNQKGWDEHTFNPDKFFRRIAEQNLKPGQNIDDVVREVRADWKFIQQNMTPKSFFERKRSWRIPPEWIEKDPQKIWSRYNASAAKRYSLLDHFGQPFEDVTEDGTRKLNYPQLKQFIGQIGQEAGMDAQRYTDNMMDLIVSRSPTDFQMKKIASDIQETQLISKLGPLSTVQNLSQGFLGSIYQHGFKNALKGISEGMSKEGGEWARKTGLVGEGFYSTPRHQNMTGIWKRISGFPWSEDMNFRIVTNSAKDFLKDLYPKLVNNPENTAVRKHFQLHGLDPDKILAQGKLTEDDLLKGSFIAARDTVFPRMTEQAVKWANDPTARLLYQFMHYQLKQPEMLAKQFKVSKMRGLAALSKYLAASAVTGEVTADMWALIKGRERPEDPIPRILDNIISAGGLGIPGEIFRTLKAGYGDMFSLGPSISGLERTIERGYNDLQHGDAGKLIEDLLRAKLRGDIPATKFTGPPIPAGANIEAMFPREPLKKKEKSSGGFKKYENMGKFKGYGSFSSY